LISCRGQMVHDCAAIFPRPATTEIALYNS
jgi:hypothetical protein